MRTSFVLTLLFVALQVDAAEPLRWKWVEGDTQRYVMTQSMEMSVDAGPAGTVESASDQQMLMTWTAQQVGDDGAATLQQRVERIVLDTQGPGGQSYRYDSDAESPPLGMAAMLAPMFEAIASAPMTSTMLPTGAYEDVEFSEEITDSMRRLPGGALSADMVRQMTQLSLVAFPAGELEVGQAWSQSVTLTSPQAGELLVVTTCTYNGPKEVDGQTLESIGLRIDLEAGEPGAQPFVVVFDTRESAGEMLFDREAGRLVSSEVTTTVDLTTTAGELTSQGVMKQAVALRALGPDEELDWAEPQAAEDADE